MYVIAWVAVKFEINNISVALEMGQNSRRKANRSYPFPIQQKWYLSKIFTVISKLFHVNTDFCWCFHVHNVQIALVKHLSH